MDPITMGLLFAGLGVGKSELVDRPKEERQRKLAAEQTRWSPWTGIKPQEVQEADPIGSGMQFGMTGAAMGQGMQNQANQNGFNAAMLKKFGGGSAWMPGMPTSDIGPVSNGQDYGDTLKMLKW